MSEARYSYDENAEVWPYFALTLVSVFVVPSTINQAWALFRPSTSDSKGHSVKRQSGIEAFRRSYARSKSWKARRTWLLIVGWVLFAVIIGIIRNQPDNGEEIVTFDPYGMLGVSFRASEREIKSAYRKLSLQFHPDKIRDFGEMTKEMVEARYVELTKAYRALTDEDTRENMRLYGHPDGPQPTTNTMALPSFLVGGGSMLVVLSYIVGMGVLLPYFVGSWWTHAQARTRKGLLQATAASFTELIVKEQPHFLTATKLVKTIAECADMDAEVPELSVEERLAKLNSYLARTAENDYLALRVAVAYERLLLALQDIAADFKNPGLSQRIIEVHRCIVQVVPLNMTRQGHFLQLPNAPIAGNATPEQAKEAVAAGRHFTPHLQLLAVSFKVSGEDQVTPNSRTYLQLKYTVQPIGAPPPSVDVEVLKLPVGHELTDPTTVNAQAPALPIAHAPYYPLDVPTRWYAFIVSEADNKIAAGPVEIANMDLSNLKLNDKEFVNEAVINTLNLALPTVTPPFTGIFPFKVMVLSSTYFGCDITQQVPMQVVNPPAAASPEVDYGDDEAAAKAQAGEGKDDDEDDEEESDEEDDLSDIDTDTEDESEEDNKPKKDKN